MFDVEKIRSLATLLETIPEYFDDVYIVHDGTFLSEAAKLFKRLKLPIRAIMSDTMVEKELFGWKAVKTAEASVNFNERTVLILLVKESVPFVRTTFDFKVKGGTWTVPALVISNEELAPIYDRVMFLNVLRQYKEDGTLEKNKNLSDLIERFARGLTTDLDHRSRVFKYQIWSKYFYFKPTYTFDDTAIVIQGPIIYMNNYTAETFKFYRAIYHNIHIVVSTWQGEAKDSFRKECRDNSVVLLENEPPKVRGPANINMQLLSSLQGARYVKENTNAKFVLKTRTDQRVNFFSVLPYFKNLLKTFPPKDNKLHERIILLGSKATNTFPFNFHDFLAFGHVDDISRLYDIPLHGERGVLNYYIEHRKRADKIGGLVNSPKNCVDYDTVTEPSHKLFKLNKAMKRIYWPESYIMRKFHEKYIAPIDTTKLFEMSWKFTVDYLILVDFATIQLDWPKREAERYKAKFNYHGQDAFVRWLDMYRNFKIDWV